MVAWGESGLIKVRISPLETLGDQLLIGTNLVYIGTRD